MSNPPKTQNDTAWEHLFDRYDILNRITAHGRFKISASQIKEFREPRLMAKFDHIINLPKIFADNHLAILPITRGDYVISHFAAYHTFEAHEAPITKVSLPKHVESLNSKNIISEAIALNCAVASGIVADFLEDEDIVPTVAGRMGSGVFDFTVADSKGNAPHSEKVVNSQIEIDAAYEGVKGLALVEAKRDLSKDFLIRQLYYPFRAWKNRVKKAVRTLFLVYSNGIFRLYEYKFKDIFNYNSLVLVKHKNYSIEDTAITIADIQEVLRHVNTVAEPHLPFPQADSFERVINICELLNEQELTRTNVTDQYAFDVRQTNYYTDAALYLGLIEKRYEHSTPVFSLSDKGKNILKLDFKQRQLAYCRCILSHKVFGEIFQGYLERGKMPSTEEIMETMKHSNLYHIMSDNTFNRRASTIKSWVSWMIGLTKA